jgi:hypothetical protein
MRTIYPTIKRKARTWFESSSFGFRMSLRSDYGATGPHGYPEALWHNAVLKREEELNRAINQVQKLGLPLISDAPKNWDSLAALDLILRCTDKKARIFDAGGELYSMILPWLFLYGYRNLSAGNLVFETSVKKGPIVYRYSNITKTEFDSNAYDAITCLSVIEHGVNLRSYFCEMSRILKPGGVLITSADYFETEVDTRGQVAYGVPIHIFAREEIAQALEIAGQFGLTLTSPIDLSAEEKIVNWKEYDLNYTFVIFSLRKSTGT